MYRTANPEYDRRPIEQMRNEAVETPSPKGLISGITEGSGTTVGGFESWTSQERVVGEVR